MRCLFLLAVLVLAAWPAQGQSAEPARPLAERIEDLRATAAVRAALAQDAQTRPYDVGVTTQGGVVTLVGVVGSLGARDRAEALAREVEGVRAVQNGLHLEGQPAPSVATAPPVYDDGAAEEEEPEAAEPAPESPRPVYHTVRRGDTLYAIARRYGTTVQALRRLNDLRSTDIRVGQRLRVR